MKQQILMEKYPIFELDLPKTETSYQTVDAILQYFKHKIDAHPVATYIATFDHLSHTKTLVDGSINDTIIDAKLIVFCFGLHLPNPHVLAVRPRSIGVADMGDKFVINFLEPPMPVATEAMEAWAKALKNNA